MPIKMMRVTDMVPGTELEVSEVECSGYIEKLHVMMFLDAQGASILSSDVLKIKYVM